ncbi:glycosyltransferase family 2 protein [Nonomuraea sp. MTCD27]|uniref:glycosyltransferase family 2 protein n=1 Tax=Nonomuraea sp. MTCD27 TaxID=1676747 RepID=UPI0035BED156
MHDGRPVVQGRAAHVQALVVNPWTNWLTRRFAAEYAAHFSLVLRGLDRYRLPIPLGGTSNHFRADARLALGGWDTYNVTEDADLGIRIARRGWDVRMMVSVTEEEANSRLGNWIRQRSRWIKGYLQTWLVHTRHPLRLWRELGTRRTLAFHLTMGLPTLTTLANPFFWALTLLYLCTGTRYVQALFPPASLYRGAAAMVIGNFLMIYCMMAGCLERRLFSAVRAMLSIPLYWALMSVAAYKALFQLLRPGRRHYCGAHGARPRRRSRCRRPAGGRRPGTRAGLSTRGHAPLRSSQALTETAANPSTTSPRSSSGTVELLAVRAAWS